jgi:hypothetical protein
MRCAVTELREFGGARFNDSRDERVAVSLRRAIFYTYIYAGSLQLHPDRCTLHIDRDIKAGTEDFFLRFRAWSLIMY